MQIDQELLDNGVAFFAFSQTQFHLLYWVNSAPEIPVRVCNPWFSRQCIHFEGYTILTVALVASVSSADPAAPADVPGGETSRMGSPKK